MPSRKRKTDRKPPSNRINTENAQAYAAGLLNLGAIKGDVKRALAKKYRSMSPRTAEDIITAARGMLIVASGMSEDEHRDASFRVYHSIFSNAKKGDWVKLKARELADKLLALPGPLKVELSGGLAHTAQIAAGLIRDEEIAKVLDTLDEKLAARRSAALTKKAQADIEVPNATNDSRPGDPTGI